MFYSGVDAFDSSSVVQLVHVGWKIILVEYTGVHATSYMYFTVLFVVRNGS